MSRSDRDILWVRLIDTNAYRPLSAVLEFIKDDTGEIAQARFSDGIFNISPGFSNSFLVEMELKSRVMDKPEWLI